MLTVLYQTTCETIAKTIESDLSAAFTSQVETKSLDASSATSSMEVPAWDDLLIVIFDANPYPDAGNKFIEIYKAQRGENTAILPVAVDPSKKRPPQEVEAIKALPFDGTDLSRQQLVNRSGAMLGLRWQGRDSNLFISYREKDGKVIAEQVYAYFTALGHRPFLDQAQEIDGLTRILPGSPVQKEIDKALDSANLILLIDTPEAPGSVWIKHEIETADALMLPVLPITFRATDDRKKGPRFPSLGSLGRWVALPLADSRTPAPLAEAQLEDIVSEAENYYCDIFRRKCRVPYLVETEFKSHGFTWNALNLRLLIFESTKKHNTRINTSVLSHCSIFDQIHTPAIRRFMGFLETAARANRSLFIYDGELLSEPQMEGIARDHEGSDLIILHHQELATLIETNFTALRMAP